MVLLEASDRVGGAVGTRVENGFLAEWGPNTLLESSSRITALIASLGLEGRRRVANPEMKHRYIVRSASPFRCRFPPAFLSVLFFLKAKLRLLKEPFIAKAPADLEESLATFVERRLGKEVLDYAIANPFVAGIYAGDPDSLSVRHAFPQTVCPRAGSRILDRGSDPRPGKGLQGRGSLQGQSQAAFV